MSGPRTEADRLAQVEGELEEARYWLNVEHADPGTIATAQVHATLAVAEAILLSTIDKLKEVPTDG